MQRRDEEDSRDSSISESAFRTEEFAYDLPKELIAQDPVTPRDASRLMVLDRSGGSIRHALFRELPDLLNPGDTLVVNESRVFAARLFGRKPGGGRVEVLLVEPAPARDGVAQVEGGAWRALLRPARGARPELEIRFEGGWRAVVHGREDDGMWRIGLLGSGSTDDFLDEQGHVPLPPYIRRPDRPEDRASYQTIFARITGSVAAPTAGLHFTEGLMQRLRARGVDAASVTLHVGPGTFRPVREKDLRKHSLHAETYSIPQETSRLLEETRRRGGRIVCVGTTTVRTLESVAGKGAPGGPLCPAHSGRTSLFIHPPFRFRLTDVLITNFHLPRSTLLMLVCAFAGRRFTLRAYEEAVRLRYRFYSYGDAMLIL